MVNDLVSVIIPVYGNGEYIQRSVDSALNQTYPLVEVIVVDDNGLNTDNQKKVEKKMAKYKDDERVKYICHEVNKNGSAARNTGVKSSEGEYIALLDDDDEFNPEKLEIQVEVLKGLKEDYALTYCSIEVCYANQQGYVGHVYMDGYLLKEILLLKVEISTPSLVIRRSAYDAIGGFDETFKRHQDHEFLARMADKFKFKPVDYVGFRRYVTKRNSAKDAETAKIYCEHYLEKMAPYIAKMDKKTQKDVLLKRRLNVAFEFFRYQGIKAFFKEYFRIKPGYRGVKFIFKRVWINVYRALNGRKKHLNR